MSNVTITSYKCFHQRKGLKGIKRHYDVILTSNSNLMLPFEFSDPKLVSKSHTKLQSNIIKMTELFKNFTFLLSQILQGAFCNFVAMVTPQNLTNCYNLQNVSAS